MVCLECGVKSIGANACNNVPTLSDIRIPSSVTSIGNHAFNSVSSSAEFSCAWLDKESLPTFGTKPFGDMKGFTIKLPTQYAFDSPLTNDNTLQACNPKYVVDPLVANDVYVLPTSSDKQGRYYVVTTAPTYTTAGKMALVGANVANNNGCLSMDDATMESDSKIAMRGWSTRPMRAWA